MVQDQLFKEIIQQIKDNPARVKLFREIGQEILDEIRFYESRADFLPTQDREIKAVWVLSGSGSYYDALLDNEGDQSLRDLKAFYGTDRARIDFVEKFINSCEGFTPELLYNGTAKQNQDLIKAIKKQDLNLKLENVKIIEGTISSTLDQVKKFRYPAGIKILPGEKLAILSHAPHMSRILRMMNKFSQNFKGAKIVPISIKLNDPAAEKEFIRRELLGTLDYINKGEATTQAYENKQL
jgi:hypothetical protein